MEGRARIKRVSGAMTLKRDGRMLSTAGGTEQKADQAERERHVDGGLTMTCPGACGCCMTKYPPGAGYPYGAAYVGDTGGAAVV